MLREFAPGIEVICLNGAGEELCLTLEDLLPHSFGPEVPAVTAPAEGALRILQLEPVDFCCGEVLAEPQVWVLAEDRTRKAPLSPDPSRQSRGTGPCPRRSLPPVGSAHLNQNMPPVLMHRRH